MNVISTLENLLGLSPKRTSIGSCLQSQNSACFQLSGEAEKRFPWPMHDYWIISRELMLYAFIDLSDIPANHRAKVLAQKILRLSPFQDTGQHMVREGDSAMVWLWDEKARLGAVGMLAEQHPEYSQHIENLAPLPETLLLPRTESGGVQRSCYRGVEIQTWVDSRLFTSVWQPADEDQSLSIVSVEPWGQAGGAGAAALEKIGWRVGLLAILLAVFFQIGTLVGWSVRNERLSDAVDAARLQVSELVALRTQVRQLKSDNDLLLSWVTGPSQLALVAEFDELMPASLEIVEWDYQLGELSVVIEDAKLENRSYVENLSRSSRFTEVRVEPGASAERAVIVFKVANP